MSGTYTRSWGLEVHCQLKDGSEEPLVALVNMKKRLGFGSDNGHAKFMIKKKTGEVEHHDRLSVTSVLGSYTVANPHIWQRKPKPYIKLTRESPSYI